MSPIRLNDVTPTYRGNFTSVTFYFARSIGIRVDSSAELHYSAGWYEFWQGTSYKDTHTQ